MKLIIIIFAVIAFAIAAAIYGYGMYMHNDRLRHWHDENRYKDASRQFPR